jgi:hypothetical protein
MTHETPHDQAAQGMADALGIHFLAARHQVGDLVDSEIAQIIAAGHDVAAIETVTAKAHDRRRDAAALEAQREMAERRRSALAQRAVEMATDVPSASASELVAALSADEQEQLADALDQPQHRNAIVNQLLQAVAERHSAPCAAGGNAARVPSGNAAA